MNSNGVVSCKPQVWLYCHISQILEIHKMNERFVDVVSFCSILQLSFESASFVSTTEVKHGST